MLKIFDQSHEAVGYIKKYRDCKIESVLSTAEKTLSFTYLAKSKKIDYEYYIQTKDAEYVVKAIRITSDGYPEYTATLNMEELETKTWETFLAKDSSLRDTANLALVGTGWRVAECTVDKKRSMGLQNVTSKVVLQKLCTVFMCEMQVDSKAKTVSFKEKFGEDKGVYFLRGLNLRQLTLSGDTYDFYTRIIPVGKDNLKITSVNNGKEYIDNFQYSKKIIPYVWQDTSYEDAATLMEDATEKLKDLSIPKKSYTVDVRDLAYRSAEYGILEYNLGDTITLIDRKNGIRDKQRITKITEYPENPDKNTCDIANTRETFDEIQSRLKEAVSIIEAAKNLDGSINGNAVDKVTTDQILGFKDGVESEIQNSGTISGIYGRIEATTAEIGTIKSTYLQVTEADIKYATIDLANIKNGSIKTAMIDVGAVNTAQIADGSITDAKIVELTANKITAGTLSVERLEIRGSNRSIVYALNNITGAIQAQNVDTLNGEILTPRTITADKIVAQSITGGEIAAKTILANHIDVADLFAQKIEAIDIHITGNSTVEGTLITGVLKSKNYKYTSGVYADSGAALDLDKGLIVSKGFMVNGTTGEVFFKGKLEGPSGYIGGFNIDGSDLIVNKSLANGTTAKFTLSGTGAYGNMIEIYNGSLGKNVFVADYLGYLHAEDVSFNTISAASLALSSDLGVHGNMDVQGHINGTLYGSASSMRNAGINVIGMVASDTVTTWGDLLNSVHFINNESTQIVTDNPSTWGMIFNMAMGSDVHQIWCTQPSGALFHRGGNSSGWSGTWREIVDSSNYARITGEIYSIGSNWKSLASYAGDNTTALGVSGNRYTRLYAASATISTSDENEKSIISGITGAYEKTFLNLKPILYRWKNNDAKKHDRVHCGLGAQSVLSAAKENGLTALTFAAICRDDLEEPTADGRTERWGIAYEELIPLTIHMTQKAFEKIGNIESAMDGLNRETIKIAFLQDQIEQLYSYVGELKMQISERG